MAKDDFAPDPGRSAGSFFSAFTEHGKDIFWIVLAIIIFVSWRSIAKSLGLVGDPEDKREAKTEQEYNDNIERGQNLPGWDPSYFESSSATQADYTHAGNIAKEIADGFGGGFMNILPDDEEAIYTAISKIDSNSVLSMTNQQYLVNNRILLDFDLKKKLSEDEYLNCMAILGKNVK
jgi:hypothetical protein